jgi:hypothetical protein
MNMELETKASAENFMKSEETGTASRTIYKALLSNYRDNLAN